jgi:CheY-like chemotaxis protein
MILPDADAQNYDLRFSVEDTGIGIEEKYLEHVFEPFTQLKNESMSHEGTGLGLAISRQQVELLGGKLEVKSEFGKGSTFSFEISVARGFEDDLSMSLNRVTGIVPGQTAADGRPFRLLIAEDVDVNRRFLVKLLAAFGFEVREAVNGEEVIAMWETWQPHLIFMDMRMPVLSGLDATRHIKAMPQGGKTIIIMLTASAFEEDRDSALSQGCDDFIHKPVRESQIFEILQKYLNVQFIYEPVSSRTRTSKRLASRHPEQIPDLPDEWKERMRQALTEADATQMQNLIREIETAHPDFSKTLADMVYYFDYDSIRALINPE